MKILGISSVDFDAIGQLLIRYSVFIIYWRINWNTGGQYRHLFLE
jgi:hypothetical protein